ncbi:MAG TPA: glyoxalase [Planctomycetaceae bacterium]|nr:glyoxalase [Planctomycetaceae bacterium]
MSETAPIAVRTLDHVTVVVGDLEASRTFYVDVLGMLEVPRPAFSFDGLWFQSGPTQIHLILEYDGSGPAGNLVPSEHRGARTHHFAFQVDDAHACAARLQELDVPIVAGPKERPDGAVQVFVCDPDGHVVELTSGSGESPPGVE